VSVSRLSVGRPVAVAMLVLAVVFLGAISFVRLPIDLLPSIAYPQLVIYTRYPDVGPSEVERFVSERIERAVGRVPGIERVESVSREGVSLVTLRFSWGTDMDFAALNVREQLDNIRDDMPELAARPVVLRTDPDADPIIAVSVSGTADLATLKDLSENVFKRRLEQIDGIAEAALAGGLEREIHVEVNPRLLETFGFTVDEVVRALDAANQSAPGGTIRRGRYRYALRTLGEFQTVEEIASVPLGRAQGGASSRGLVVLRDVAAVEDGFKERESMARYNGDESVGLLLFKESGANTVRVTERVDDVLEQLRRLYPDVRLDVATAQATFISDAISNVVQALVVGGILAFLVLFLFLHDARYPVAIALAIPISVIATFALLDLAGVSLNIMSLGGLALGVGMLVDNSIVVLENVFRHRELGATPLEAAARGAEEVQGAITASTLTTIAVFGPIIYVEGVAGELFGDLSFAVAFALLASLVVALTLLPTMAARWGAAETKAGLTRRALRAVFRPMGRGLAAAFAPVFHRFDAAFGRFAEWYHRQLERALQHRARVLGLAGVTLALGVLLVLMMDRAVLPDVDQGEFAIALELLRGTPIEETERAAARLEAAARGDPDVSAVFTRVGRQAAIAGVEEHESGLNTARIEVRLAAGAATGDVLARLRPRFDEFPPGAVTVETGTATALGRLLGGEEADLAVRVRGDDLDQLWNYARLAEQRLQRVPDLTNVRLRAEEGQPEIRVEIARERAAAYGIEPRLIAQTVEQYMRGAVATEYVDFDEKVPILVRLPEAERRSLETLQTIQVNGVPLRELVETHEQLGPAEVRRRDQGRVVEIFADVARGSLDGAVTAIRSALTDVSPPRGVRFEIGGANEERARSFRDLTFAFGLALLLVYMILAAQFESFLHPFTILLSVPLATVGAALALFLSGAGLNTMSLIGIVILVGIVVNDAIVKVDFINQLRAQGLPLRAAILEAGRKRLRPILMTTVTTVLGLLPMALGIGRGADLRAPLALAVIGGITSSTALTLIVVPVAYDLFEEWRTKLRAALGMARLETVGEER
jgi:hydrophobic/amphiphilic exporter-1 (mainly G- bacteria), HAE1 family